MGKVEHFIGILWRRRWRGSRKRKRKRRWRRWRRRGREEVEEK